MSSADASKKESKVDTKYYDELFKRIKESDEFKDPEALGKVQLQKLFAPIVEFIPCFFGYVSKTSCTRM